MPTFDGLVDSIIGELHARTNSQEQLATLLTGINATDLSFQIDNVTAAGLGLYELDDELVYVKSGSADGTLAIPAWGRAQQSTVAASHASGSKVIRTPRFPRKVVKDLVQEAVQQLYPELFAIASTEFTASWSTPQYGLPTECVRVLAAEYKLQGNTDQEWIGLRRWRLDSQPNLTQFPTGKAISLADLPYASNQVRVVYAVEPVALATGASDFTSTGFRASVADLVRIVVVARLVIGPEVARGQITSAEQSERSTLVQTGSTTSVARYYQALYERKLRTEQQALYAQVPVRVVRTWT